MRHRFIPVLAVCLFILLTLFYGCRKYDEYPDIPHIDLISFEKLSDTTGVDQLGIIALSFTDGDGDLGLKPEWNKGDSTYNLFVKYFEKKKGKFEEIFLTTPDPQTGKPDTLSFNGRIPYLTPAGKTKAISGEIRDTLFINNYTSPYDTIKFQVYIEDTHLHKSNMVETPEIVVNKTPKKALIIR
ncbi:MAG: hypothetical protein Q8908_15965 [Bacteroidota bacterium]|nr:hypothetical protein [Bacteroidota bacterium]